jgi:predicted DNA-binding protein
LDLDYVVYPAGNMTTGRKNGRSKLVSVRLPFEMIEDLKKLGDDLQRPYQAVMKDAIQRGMPIVREIGATEKRIRKESRTYTSKNIQAALEKMKKVSSKSSSKA